MLGGKSVKFNLEGRVIKFLDGFVYLMLLDGYVYTDQVVDNFIKHS